MAQTHRLTDDDRGFLDRVVRYEQGNPFAEDGERLLRELAPASAGPRDTVALAGLLTARLERFDGPAPGRVDDFPAADRPRLEAAYAFLAGHRFGDEIDALIRGQAGEDEPLGAPFHDAYFSETSRRGLGRDAAERHLGRVYQRRRALGFLLRRLAGASPAMERLRRSLWNHVFTHDGARHDGDLVHRMADFPVLLAGEDGTGKGVAAAAVGRSGFIPYDAATRRFAASFAGAVISVKPSRFPEVLVESALFGHRRGAFPGAVENHDGALERCEPHGAVFIDGIETLGRPAQGKLLDALEDRVFAPLGHHGPRRFAGRLLAATSQSLSSPGSGEGVLDALHHRLAADVVEVPPLRDRLRERPEELGLLVAAALEKVLGREDPDLAAAATGALRRDLPADYPWPGNLRELEQAVRAFLIAGSYGGREPRGTQDREDAYVEAVRAGDLRADEVLGRYCAMLYARTPTYAEVAAITGLDRRTVRKHVLRFIDPG